MSRIIERALSIINDNLKDQTSSFADPISIKPMARGGRLLEDDYPTHYMPHIGRQVMALGGEPEPINKALNIAQEMPQTPLPDLRPTPVAPSVPSAEGRVAAKAPKLQKTFELENRPSTIVSPRPGKGYGPAIVPEPGVKYEDPEYTGFGEKGEEPSSYQEFSFATPDIGGMKLPPPIQHPVLNTPRMDRIAAGTAKIFKSKGFQDLIEDHVGLDPKKLKVTPTVGLFRGELEPSFYIDHPDMQPEHAKKLGHLLGFGFQQDQAVETNHNPNINEGTLTALIGHGRKLSAQDIDNIAKAANDEKVDFSITKDGKAAKFLHFGNDAEYPEFLDKVGRIADLNKLKERYHARAEGSLINAQDYLPGIFGGSSGVERVQEGAARSPYLFGRIVDHVLAPFAKVTAGEGYRLSPERLQSAYGLTDDEAEKVRTALLPTKKGDRTTIPLMTGEEQLDVRPTGHRGKTSVDDVQFALQNRATEKGQIDPGDYSDEAKKILANDIAREVEYHVKNSQKSAVGWYDAALKKAKGLYHQIFPEIKTNKDNELLFDALLGITSQGNDVYNNSVHAARLYNKIRDGMSLKEATQSLKGSFGSQTRAIEQNLNKFHHLIETNGYDRMRDLFNQTKTVSEWKKILNSDPTLRGPNGEKLSVKGSADQKITGWSVFGPKIGSFINNLHGDYSTLTADLWFSRTWNRLLGHNFIHSPLAEQKQYQDFRDAFKQEFLHNNGFPFERMPLGLHALENGQPKYEKGEPVPWEHGEDTKGMTYGEFEEIYNDPDKLLNYAQDLYKKYSTATKGVPAFSVKSDLRRRAKNWAENRELSEAAPRGDRERNFQQETVEKAQKLLKKKGLNISIADIQAALWFHEKELFNKLGVATERAKPADYEDAARKTMELVKSNKLYHVKSREGSADQEEGADEEDKIEKARGGAITPIEISTRDLDDEARRLILWSYATAPLFHKAEGGSVSYPTAMPTEIKEDIKSGEARMKNISPQEFLDEADPLHIGKGDRHIINSFKKHIEHGDRLGPLKLYEGGHQDGRHRANAAKALGIKKVPVIDYRKAEGGAVNNTKAALEIARRANKDGGGALMAMTGQNAPGSQLSPSQKYLQVSPAPTGAPDMPGGGGMPLPGADGRISVSPVALDGPAPANPNLQKYTISSGPQIAPNTGIPTPDTISRWENQNNPSWRRPQPWQNQPNQQQQYQPNQQQPYQFNQQQNNQQNPASYMFQQKYGFGQNPLMMLLAQIFSGGYGGFGGFGGFGRQFAEGGVVDDPAAKAVDTAREMTEDRQLTPMGFYSAAAEAASKFPQKAPIDQIINKIKGQPNVKKEELDNANLADAFAGQRSVDPKEVARHLQENVPNIKEKVYGGKPAVEYKPKALLERPEGFEDADDVYEIGPYGKPPHLISVKTNYESVMPHKYSVYGPSGYHSTYFTLSDAVAHANHSINNIEQPLYKEYTVPGGKNYREVVMALPQKGGTKAQFRVTGALPDVFDSKEEAENYIQQLRQKAERNPNIARKLDRFPMNIITENKPITEPYKSSHWLGIPNPLAHLRMSDRDNGKTLHLEELQSDWGQEGRKKGFYDSNRPEEKSIMGQMARDVSSAVPSGPYVTDTNQWVDLGLKRALMEAAKGGYNKLIWTPGEQQAKRYDLSKQIDRLVYNPNAEILMAYKDGRQIINKSATKNELEGIVGKDVAKNLLASEGQTLPDAGSTKYHILEGQDLSVGGEGMKAFYDKLLPQRLNKLVAQYDKDAKVQLNSHKITIPGETGQKLIALREIDPTNSFDYEDRDIKAHSIEITPKLREAILKGGLPAFEKGGPVIDAAFDVLSKLRR